MIALGMLVLRKHIPYILELVKAPIESVQGSLISGLCLKCVTQHDAVSQGKGRESVWYGFCCGVDWLVGVHRGRPTEPSLLCRVSGRFSFNIDGILEF